MNHLLRLWTGPLPKEELFPDREYAPLTHWFIHPVKRRLAKYYLLILQKFFGLIVIGITGSVGKTTTKKMLESILPGCVATADNTTSTYNIPSTILRTPLGTKYLILEMGVEYIGDMDFYLWLAHPDIAIIAPISLTHTQYLKNLETIISEKNKITKYAKHVVSYKNIKASGYEINQDIVAQVAAILKVPANLNSFIPPAHRMNFIILKNGSILIDDSYNASPLSTQEALKTLVKISKEKKLTPVFIFGQMNELGQYEKDSHEEVGKLIKKFNIKNLYCIGPATKHTISSAGFGSYFENQEDLLNVISNMIHNSLFIILIKGSHSWHLENLVDKLLLLSS
ncbi:MAG: UDP-N-acetylmuramoyl-tripeptide--D-alanyl-D-alanine ligase [Microgenomates group bacterium Gr01-1014_16]|nr:MAG: UDP-N-acetylmuramoyl-tripeptide--D-alanyl-D-alanine ligase [Microgenomates group bacterium Gr01-1014_16]